MKLVIFGLTVSSSWGNGHATLWRGLIRALARTGHEVTFFERDVDYYAAHRDCKDLPGGAQLLLYADWASIEQHARRLVAETDAVIITSYCPDARAAARLVFDGATAALRVFYDLDTPVTLARFEATGTVDYVPAEGLRDFDLVLSYTGGEALCTLRRLLGARKAVPLYGHVDPDVHRPVTTDPASRSHLSYLGTYAPDRQGVLERMFIDPAQQMPARRFLLGGAGYPLDFPWKQNIWFVHHVPPPAHSAFYSSSRLTLNVTRADMAQMGFCPSGRLFEAAACGVPVLSDAWKGLEQFFTPGEQILLADSTDVAISAIDSSTADLERIGRAARERVLDEHTSAERARQLIQLLEE
jgi:spore maturation protein CgeB